MCSAALLEPDAWLSLPGAASALLVALSAAEGLLMLPAVELCSAAIDVELLASSARAKLGVRAVAKAIAVSSARARCAMPWERQVVLLT